MGMYEIKSSKSIAKDWSKLEENFPDAMERCKKFCNAPHEIKPQLSE
jgi:hypothetical protein